MRELSLHVLDVVENGIAAGARCITIRVEESTARDRLEITIRDDGRGMPAEKIRNLADPFVTTRTTRRVGLGLSLLAAAARRCEGDIRVDAEPGRGTEVTAFFRRSHIDRAPLGDMAATMGMLIIGNPHLDIVYTHRLDEGEFVLDTRELKAELEGLSLSEPVVVQHLTESIRRSLNELASGPGEGTVNDHP
ncbi:MAG: ATP-binding protein [Deltaproteobacteria bacterium]|nr:ATP-binding protein [Deltaproteobacteria bacterium]